MDVQNKKEAVAKLTQEESTNIYLLVARPETEMGSRRWKDSDREDFLEDLVSENEEELQTQRMTFPLQQQVENEDAEASPKSPRHFPQTTGLSRSQEMDSGVGRTDESTRNDESSEHDFLGDEQTSSANTPGSQRRLRFLRGDNQQCHEFHHSLDSLLAADGSGPYNGCNLPPGAGFTDKEYERYRELLEITCHMENGNGPAFLYAARQGGLDVNRNESVLREMAVLEEELRHLEFKFRNVLRAQKMQQLRERCMKAWLEEEESLYDFVGGGGANNESSTKLPDITELPERSDKDTTSAYNTGESCRSTPLMMEPPLPLDSPLRKNNDPSGAFCQAAESLSNSNMNRGHSINVPPYPGSPEPVPSKFRSLCRERHQTKDRLKRGSKPRNELDRESCENNPYLSSRRRSQGGERYRSCLQLAQPKCIDELDVDPTCRKNIGVLKGAHSQIEPRMEWKVKIKSDGTRYVTKRPVRDRLLKARAMKIKEERSGMTTDDDAVSEMKMGRYWSKEDRKRHLMQAREQRKRREFMMQSKLDFLREQQQQGSEGKGEMSLIALSHQKTMKKRNKKILDNWITIQEMLAHGTCSADGKRVYNPLLSVTTV
uniref:PDZ domain containing 4 n=3 Tax=Pyxicephalus adspersus TaxID=30357 RepID=A0AAV2ZDQ3_PYXAD|nr:TPA: hypothetical protein GDO54_017108 [Pyxicephalus adspersus]